MRKDRERRVLWVVGLGTALSLLGDASLYTVLPTHTREAGVTLAAVGVLLSVNRLIRLVLNGPAGWLCDRWPRRRLFVPALFAGALSTALYALTGGYAPLLAARLLWGLSWAALWVAGNAIVLDVARDDNRGRLIGLYNVFFFLGTGSGALLGGWLTDLLGYHSMFLLASLVSLVGALLALFFLPETSQAKTPSTAQTESATFIGAEGRAEMASLTPRSVGSFWLEMATAITLMGINRLVMAGLFFPTFGLCLLSRLGKTVSFGGLTVGVTTLTGVGLSASTFLGLLFVPLVGSLSDRWSHRWLLAALGLFPGVVGFVLLAFGRPWMIVLALPLLSITSSSNQVLATARVGDLAGPQKSGRALGLLFTAGDLGSAIGPLVAFALLRALSLPLFYSLAGSLWLLMALLILPWIFHSPQPKT